MDFVTARESIIEGCRYHDNQAQVGRACFFFSNEVDPVLRDNEFCGGEREDLISGVWENAEGNTFDFTCVDRCDTDFNEDFRVDGSDLNHLFANWGSDDQQTDLNGDGMVDGSDLNLVLEDWGPCGGKQMH